MSSLTKRIREVERHVGPKKAKYLEARAMGLSPHQAALAAGYSDPRRMAYHLEHLDRDVARANSVMEKAVEKKLTMTRLKVMELVNEGLDMARRANDAGAFFRGITEINKMQGYYEPEKRTVEVNITVKEQLRQLETLSEEELLEKLGGERALSIDGEYEEVAGETEGPDPVASGGEGDDWEALPYLPEDDAGDPLLGHEEGPGDGEAQADRPG